MEDFVRKTKGVRDITSLPLDTSHELDIVSDVKGKIYIKILNRYKELLFDNGTEQWVIDMLNNLEVDLEQLKEDILDVEQALSELPIIEDKLATVETTLAQINTLFAQMQIDVQGLDLRTAELEREVVQLALKDQELLDKINNLDLDLDILYSNSTEFGDYDYSAAPNLLPTLDYSKLSRSTSVLAPPLPYIKDYGDYFVLDSNDASAVGTSRNCFVPFLTRLTKGKTYTLSVSMMVDDEFADNQGYYTSPLYYTIYTVNPAASDRLATIYPSADMRNQWKRVSKVFTIPADQKDGDYIYLQLYQAADVKGKLYVRYDIKIEEGSSATPYQPNLLEAPYYLSKVALNDKIPYYKYVGINLEASKNPKDYQWIPLSKAAETVDARLTKTISTYDTVNALQNNRLTTLESKVVDTTWQNVTVTEPFTSVTQPQVKKQNGIVYMRGTISNGTGDCFTLPEGFRPPAGAYEMQFRLPCRSASASDYATIYVRPSGLCSIAGVNGTTPIFLSGIIFSTT